MAEGGEERKGKFRRCSARNGAAPNLLGPNPSAPTLCSGLAAASCCIPLCAVLVQPRCGHPWCEELMCQT